jgi:hypothetical protein
MQIRKLQLRGNNSVCAGTFQLLRGRASAQLRGNIVRDINEDISTETSHLTKLYSQEYDGRDLYFW